MGKFFLFPKQNPYYALNGKAILFKFYAIQYDRIWIISLCFSLSVQSSTAFRTSKTERKCGELSARNLTDAVYCCLNGKRFVSTTVNIESEASLGIFFSLFQK